MRLPDHAASPTPSPIYLHTCLNSCVHRREAALRALAHPGRRRALELLAGAERTSGSVAAACGWTKPAASQQLRVLRAAGLVEVRADGNRRLYRTRREGLAELRAFLDEFWLARLAVLEDEIRRSR
jgi:DNA-binding transcriptional ArsR family regulator